jgi:hypothetical protein
MAWLPILRTLYDPDHPPGAPDLDRDALQDLAAAGLARMHLGGSGMFDATMAGGGGFVRNDFGELFVEITSSAS